MDKETRQIAVPTAEQ